MFDRQVIFTALLLLPLSLGAQPTPFSATRDIDTDWCGTGPETNRRAEMMHNLTRARMLSSPQKGVRMDGDPAVLRDGVFLMRNDGFLASGDNPVDVEGSSFRFKRVDDERYTVSKEPLQYDENIGPIVRTTDTGSAFSLEVPLTGFTFPFFEGRHNSIHLTREMAIYFSNPEDLDIRDQHGTFALLEEGSVPVMAALMIPHGVYRTNISLQQSSELVRITYRSTVAFLGAALDAQVTLYPSGDALYSYRKATALAGTILFSQGANSWRKNATRTLLHTMTDPADDTYSYVDVPAAIRPGLDVREIRFYKVGDDLLDIEIELNAPLDRAAMGTKYYQFDLFFDHTEPFYGDGYSTRVGIHYIHSLEIGANDYYYAAPNSFYTKNSPLATISPTLLRLTSALSAIQPPGTTPPMVGLWVSNPAGSTAEQVPLTPLAFPAPTRSLQTDFSTLGAAEPLTFGAESFTIPSLDLKEVWRRIRVQYGIDERSVDHVVVYPTFHTDIIDLAGAFTLTNSLNMGAESGIWYNYSRRRAGPVLMHMNKLEYSWNATQEGIGEVFTHEFGHRWLFSTALSENGVNGWSIRAPGNHPRQGVHHPAAFSVGSEREGSTMGGGNYTANADGTFTIAPNSSYRGYAWLDLYFMGLAKPEEVPEAFYIADNVNLRSGYNPDPGTYTGTRRNFGITGVLAAMGPRRPAYDHAQKKFRTLYVIVDRASAPATNEVLADFKTRYVDYQAEEFKKATGNRGALVTTLPTQMTASFESPSSTVVGRTVSFKDTSTDIPHVFEWQFGDGKTSTARQPVNTYERPGTYTIRLTVSNYQMSATTTRTIEVLLTEPRKRTIRR